MKLDYVLSCLKFICKSGIYLCNSKFRKFALILFDLGVSDFYLFWSFFTCSLKKKKRFFRKIQKFLDRIWFLRDEFMSVNTISDLKEKEEFCFIYINQII